MLTKFTKDYWEARALKYGHTGNGNPFLYCFDQQARLFAIQQILKKLDFKKTENALDFGCGSGDFVELLTNNFKTVHGHDISEVMVQKVKQRFQTNENIKVSSNVEDIIKTNYFDLILTVTALQTLNKDELDETLRILSSALSDNGFMVLLEFFAPEQIVFDIREDKATVKDWEIVRIKNQLKIHSSYNFYNGFITTTQSWQKYKNSPWINLLRIFKHQPFAKTIFTNTANKLIRKHGDVIRAGDGDFKILVLQKKTPKG